MQKLTLYFFCCMFLMIGIRANATEHEKVNKLVDQLIAFDDEVSQWPSLEHKANIEQKVFQAFVLDQVAIIEKLTTETFSEIGNSDNTSELSLTTQSLLKLYQFYATTIEVNEAQAAIKTWFQNLPESLQQDKRIQIHFALVNAYTKIRLSIFSFEIQELINHLHDIKHNDNYKWEQWLILWTLTNRGWGLEHALSYGSELLNYSAQFNIPIHRFVMLYNIAVLTSRNGLEHNSLTIAEKYIALANKHDDDVEKFFGFERLANSHTVLGQHQHAISAYQQAKSFTKLTSPLWLAQLQLGEAENYYALGQIEKADSLFTQALTYYQSEKNHKTMPYLTKVKGIAAIAKQDNKQAIKLINQYANEIKAQVEKSRMDNIHGVQTSMQSLLDRVTKSQQLALSRYQLTKKIIVGLFSLGGLLILLIYFQIRTSKQLRLKSEELKTLSRIDGLTNIYNRRYWQELAELELTRLIRYQSPKSCLVMFDIDHFKQVNDQFGHVAGDLVIQKVGNTVSNLLRESDLFGRYGGEEFALLLPHTEAEQASVIAERIRQTIAKLKVKYDQHHIEFTMSFGICEYQKSLISLKDWIDKTDQALYQAKNSGRNTVVVSHH